ncbi:MAG: PhzF family phenazine biosynthesis protein [Verrucomicrobiota bacterium]
MVQHPLKLYWVDAFTKSVFGGNPAAVVPLKEWPEDRLLQSIAFENGLSETAFVVSNEDETFYIRWFTPTAEVDLCGHATLAAAYVIQTKLGFPHRRISFHSRSGILHVDGLEDGKFRLDFPSRPPVLAKPPEALIRGLGAVPSIFAHAEANLAIFETEEQVLSLTPNFEVLATLPQYGTIATAPSSDCDFVSRFFAPRVGVPEDAVTGSAHCVLAPYWAERLGKCELYARQISARGGELWCELKADRVTIAGHAVLYLEATLHLHP